jgi:hypothetical protein
MAMKVRKAGVLAVLVLGGSGAVGLGASDKELAALPVLTNEQIRALTIRASAI